MKMFKNCKTMGIDGRTGDMLKYCDQIKEQYANCMYDKCMCENCTWAKLA